MNYGLYLSTSGVLTNSYRQDVFANNLANVNTVGFKPDLPTLRQRPAEAVEDLTPFGSSHELLDRLGGGVLAGPQLTSFDPGPIEQTHNPLDAAIDQPNRFFAVQSTDPNTGESITRLTRDGRFSVNAEGQLITATGHAVLDPNDQPIALAPGLPASITPNGNIVQNGQPVATLQVAAVNDPTQLMKAGRNLFAFGNTDPRVETDVPVQLRVGHVESSSTNAIATLMQITGAAKAASANANLIKYHDSLMDGAINTLGRVA